MALYSELPVYKATYDLLLAIFGFTKDFGKEYKYTVGESLKKETIECLREPQASDTISGIASLVEVLETSLYKAIFSILVNLKAILDTP
jgi:hypothetical protein